jgi:VWFA-related protein
MGQMKRVSILILLIAAVSSVPGLTQTPQDTLKVSVDLINVQFTVTDRRGRLVSGLNREDFAVEEDGRKQDIRHFARENELPLTIALLVDTSPSVRPVFDEEKVTATAFLESILRRNDLALVIGFDRAVTLVQDYSEDVRALGEAIDELEIGGGTSLYDAVYLACEEKLDKEAGRKAIVLISDGEDTTSKTRFNQALVAAHQSDTVIYAISNTTGGFRRSGGDRGTLRRFAEETGGGAYFLDNRTDFKEIFDQIAQELRSQYSLAYNSTNTVKDGKYRKIRIVPRNSSYQIKARKGYYAPRNLDSQ